jgi:Rha family phage regulatory protein
MNNNQSNNENNIPKEPKELVKIDFSKRIAITTSLVVADFFEKEHTNVLADIKNLDCSEDFKKLNFKLFEELVPVEGTNIKRPSKYYEITKDGFWFLVMGYKGKRVAPLKETYIMEFNKKDEIIEKLKNQLYAPHREELEYAEKVLIQAKNLLDSAYEKSNQPEVKKEILDARHKIEDAQLELFDSKLFNIERIEITITRPEVKYIGCNITLELHQKFQQKCLESDVTQTAVITDLLEKWVK